MSINVAGNLLSSTGFTSSGEIANTPNIVTDGTITDDETYFLDDIIHMGSSETMDIFCDLGNVFRDDYPFRYLRQHLKMNDIKLQKFNFKSYAILREISSHLNPITDYYKIMQENHKYYSPASSIEILKDIEAEIKSTRNKLITFGCSYTAGNPISFPDINGKLYTDNNSNYVKNYKKNDDDLTWSEIVSNKLNLDLYNFGCGGYSNDMILDSIINNWDKIGTDDYVIIEQTYTHRFDVPNLKRNTLVTVNPNVVDYPIHDNPFTKKECEHIAYTSVLMGSDIYKKRYNKRFLFILKMLYELKNVKKCLIWNVEDVTFNNPYEQIYIETKNEIIDHHWSYKGHKDFSNYILKEINTEKKHYNSYIL